ncbi:MAG TPA: hypothetical protein VE997_03460 [Candidatus Limnocylindria bacterium]|jgi:hypothetical protein|nr:hypothetical protein [Candidatus Limnocylindria bacterium]
MRRWAIVNTLLGVILALVGFQIVRTWARGLPGGAPAESAASTAAAPAPEPEPREKGKRGRGDKAGALAEQTPAVLVAAIADKDLFDPSRRPPSEDTASAPAPVTKPPDNVTVTGVRIFGKDREVFMSDSSQGTAVTRRLRVGDQIAGYSVKAIERAAVTLTSPSGDVVNMPLALDKGKAPPTAPRPPMPGRPPQPASAQPVSPAAGVQGPSPAAGVGGNKPPVLVPPAPLPGAVPKPAVSAPLPPQVQQKLDQLKQNDKRRRR